MDDVPPQDKVNDMFGVPPQGQVSLVTQSAFDAALSEFLCGKDQSISVVNSVLFRKLIATICPGVKIPHRTTVSKNILGGGAHVHKRQGALVAK
ncbi:hypothetical protein H9P43_000062 [Blastocladiella emersonii ATCC 22665]|nr:hypothetical protein H9P43_000062 [Blastocladiella emersonii ATCC 22665]